MEEPDLLVEANCPLIAGKDLQCDTFESARKGIVQSGLEQRPPDAPGPVVRQQAHAEPAHMGKAIDAYATGRQAMTPSVRARTSGDARHVATAS